MPARSESGSRTLLVCRSRRWGKGGRGIGGDVSPSTPVLPGGRCGHDDSAPASAPAHHHLSPADPGGPALVPAFLTVTPIRTRAARSQSILSRNPLSIFPPQSCTYSL